MQFLGAITILASDEMETIKSIEINANKNIVGFSEIKRSAFSRAVTSTFVLNHVDETTNCGKESCQQILEKELANGYLIFVNRDITDAEKFKNIIFKANRLFYLINFSSYCIH